MAYRNCVANHLPNPKVFFDICIGGKDSGRMVFELFADELSVTVENFRCLCTGETGLGYYLRPRWYRHTPFHRCIKNFMVQGGDITRGDGYGGESIYGQYFRDEKHVYKHSLRGILSMAKTRYRHTNSSQFFITFAPCSWLDNKHIVFGQIVAGHEVLDSIEEQGSDGGWLQRPVSIWNCGELTSPTDDQLNGARKELSPDSIVGKTARSGPISESIERPERIVTMKTDEEDGELPLELYRKYRTSYG